MTGFVLPQSTVRSSHYSHYYCYTDTRESSLFSRKKVTTIETRQYNSNACPTFGKIGTNSGSEGTRSTNNNFEIDYKRRKKGHNYPAARRMTNFLGVEKPESSFTSRFNVQVIKRKQRPPVYHYYQVNKSKLKRKRILFPEGWKDILFCRWGSCPWWAIFRAHGPLLMCYADQIAARHGSRYLRFSGRLGRLYLIGNTLACLCRYQSGNLQASNQRSFSR